MPRIFIADDHEIVRASLRQLLERSNPAWKVCGEAADGEEAVKKIVKLNPDLIILDIVMPVSGGLNAARRIRARLLRTPILIYTFMDVPNLDVMAKEAGAQCVVRKGDIRALITAIRELLSTKDRLATEDVSPA